MRLTALLLSLLILPAIATAQPTQKWDASFQAGAFFNSPETDPNQTSTYDDWYNEGQLTLSVGRYLSTHLKTEFDIATTGEGRHILYVFAFPVDSYRAGTYTERFLKVTTASAGVAWQFFDNQWVHPYLAAGIAVDFDRRRSHRPEQYAIVSDPRGARQVLIPELREGPTTTRHARAWVSGGAKFYVSSTAFIRSELRVGFRKDAQTVSLSAGVGFDF